MSNSENITQRGETGKKAPWVKERILLTVLTSASLLSLFMKWFDVRYLEYFTERSSYSALGAFKVIRKLLFIGRDLTGETLSLADVFPAGELGAMPVIMVGMAGCAILLILTLVNLLLNKQEHMYAISGIAAVVSLSISAVALISMSGDALITVNAWAWIFFLLSVVSVFLSWRLALRQ